MKEKAQSCMELQFCAFIKKENIVKRKRHSGKNRRESIYYRRNKKAGVRNMNYDQKIENLLNLALNTSEEEREKSLNLDQGYNRAEHTWELIVKYHGDIRNLSMEGILQVIPLTGGYAIVIVEGDRVEEMAAQPEIEYVEKPKRLFFSVDQGRAVSCVNPLQTGEYDLRGQGILVAVIDSGVDYFHPDFRNEDGTTRIAAIWDQTAVRTEEEKEAGNGERDARTENLPVEKIRGVEYTEAQINEALAAGSREAGYRIVPTKDVSGHGTEVLGIAAGNGRASGGQYRGVAPQSRILVVKLGTPGQSFPGTVELMMALDYVIRKATEMEMPVAINLSFGNVYGSHDGTSLLETYLDGIAGMWQNVICVGTGNEGNTGGHTSGILIEGIPVVVEMGIAENETTVNLQLWKSYADQFDIVLIHPNGETLGPLQERLGAQRYIAGATNILVYYGEPKPYSGAQEIYFDFIPKGSFVDEGVWKIQLYPRNIVEGRYDFWLPSSAALNPNTRFFTPTVDTTLTIPSTSRRIIAVGAYDSRRMTYASFSGRGYTRDGGQVKPDLVAPGVDITTTAVGGAYTTVTGTSFATPFVTGAAAMLMQWGIIEGNDPFLYGEKVRAYLRRGAVRREARIGYPNPFVGYGALCVRDSLLF